ncbi:MAG: hypothetical protein ACI915_001477 [Gammaproteobacteria bacterium]|jgi:hypothetical protein
MGPDDPRACAKSADPNPRTDPLGHPRDDFQPEAPLRPSPALQFGRTCLRDRSGDHIKSPVLRLITLVRTCLRNRFLAILSFFERFHLAAI